MYRLALARLPPSQSVWLLWGVCWYNLRCLYFAFFTDTSTTSVLFHYDNYYYDRHVYIRGYSFFGFAIVHLPGWFCPWIFFSNIGLNMLLSDSYMLHSHFQLAYCIQDSSMSCNWLSLRCSVPWINNLPLVYWPTIWKSSFKQQLVCTLDIGNKVLCIVLVSVYIYIYIRYTYILKSRNI